jgi:regulator of CtrA degradation
MDRTAPELHRRLIDQLYVESMLLADDARGYFDLDGSDERVALDPLQRVLFACESLKVTTRLMHVVAWLLTQRAVDAGELRPREALDPSRRLGDQPLSDMVAVAKLPDAARALIQASIDLHRRVALIDDANADARPRANPVASLQARLAYAF